MEVGSCTSGSVFCGLTLTVTSGGVPPYSAGHTGESTPVDSGVVHETKGGLLFCDNSSLVYWCNGVLVHLYVCEIVWFWCTSVLLV